MGYIGKILMYSSFRCYTIDSINIVGWEYASIFEIYDLCHDFYKIFLCFKRCEACFFELFSYAWINIVFLFYIYLYF